MSTNTMAQASVSSRKQIQLRLAGMSWSHFINDGAANFLPGILPAILIGMQLPISWAGTLMTALLIGQGLQPFVGLVGDRVGGRSLSVLGLLGSSIGAGLVGFVGDPVSLVAVLVLIGVSNAFFHPQAAAGVRRISETKQGLAISTFLIGGEIGRGVWPVLAGFCVAFGGLHWLWVLALPGLVSVYILIKSAPPLPKRSQHAEPIAWAKHVGPATRVVVFCAIRAFMTYVIVTLLPLLWEDSGGALTTGASLITVLMLVGVLGNLAGGWLSEHLGARRLMLTAMAVAGVATAGLSVSHGLMLWFLTAVAGVALFTTLPLTVLIAQDLLPENRSFGSGLVIGLANALGALAVMGIGPVIHYAGVAATFWVAAGAAVVACMLIPWMPQLASEQ